MEEPSTLGDLGGSEVYLPPAGSEESHHPRSETQTQTKGVFHALSVPYRRHCYFLICGTVALPVGGAEGKTTRNGARAGTRIPLLDWLATLKHSFPL